MKYLPKARSENIIVQNLNKEILIYDLRINKAYSLNEPLSIVYKMCNGQTSFDELKRQSKFTDDVIFMALDELKAESLVEDSKSFVSPFKGMSRREVIRKVGISSMLALPLLTSLVAPTAAQAASGACLNENETCDGSVPCCTGLECNLLCGFCVQAGGLGGCL